MEPEKRIFREESLNGLNNPEDLEAYVMTVRPWWWAVGLGLFILVASLFGWLFYADMPVTISQKAMVDERGIVLVYLDEQVYSPDLLGSRVKITVPGGTMDGTVVSVPKSPMSQTELYRKLGNDWLRTNLVTGNFLYEVSIQGDEPLGLMPETLCDVTLTLNSRHPIEALAGR